MIISLVTSVFCNKYPKKNIQLEPLLSCSNSKIQPLPSLYLLYLLITKGSNWTNEWITLLLYVCLILVSAKTGNYPVWENISLLSTMCKEDIPPQHLIPTTPLITTSLTNSLTPPTPCLQEAPLKRALVAQGLPWVVKSSPSSSWTIINQENLTSTQDFYWCQFVLSHVLYNWLLP